MDITIVTFGALAIMVVLYVLYKIISYTLMRIFYSFKYSELKVIEGKITDMKYQPKRTTYSGKGVVTTYSEKNKVFFSSHLKNSVIDSDKLYQRVRIGEKIEIRYQERYTLPRFWQGSYKLHGYRLISISSVLGEKVVFNEETTKDIYV